MATTVIDKVASVKHIEVAILATRYDGSTESETFSVDIRPENLSRFAARLEKGLRPNTARSLIRRRVNRFLNHLDYRWM